MPSQPSLPLRVVDGTRLPEAYRTALRPGGWMRDPEGKARRLPRYFYEIPSWDEALRTQLTEHFGLWEFLDVDVRETEVMRMFPRYVPCAITLLAAQLEVFRVSVGSVVRIAANGGYRSPSHDLCEFATPHAWGAAANIYRVGDELMDSRDKVEKYTRQVREVLPGIWTRPFGAGAGFAFDHVHLDLGFVSVVPHGAADEAEEGDS